MHIWRTNWDSCSRLIFFLTSEQSYLVLWAREVNSNPHKVLSSSRLFDKLVSVNFSFSQIMHNGKWPPFKKQKNKSFWWAVFNQMHFIRFKSSKYALSWLVLCSLGNKKKVSILMTCLKKQWHQSGCGPAVPLIICLMTLIRISFRCLNIKFSGLRVTFKHTLWNM